MSKSLHAIEDRADLAIQLRGYAAAVRTNAPASVIARYNDRLTAIGENYPQETPLSAEPSRGSNNES